MYYLGLDIGTTTICGVVIDETENIIESKTVSNTAKIISKFSYEKIQSPKIIFNICNELYLEFVKKYKIKALGITGQMHGILYLNKYGEDISPLYTWQDDRGNLPFNTEQNIVAYLREETQYRVASGYGLVTVFCNNLKKQYSEASKICSIGDYVAMRFIDNREIEMHATNANSIGFYSLEKNEFDLNVLEKLKIDSKILPKVSQEKFIGETKENVLVYIAVGDNQASVFGCNLTEKQILINIGTGSQLSAITNKYNRELLLEQRPYFNDKYLIVGCSLSGGYSYEILKNFFYETLNIFGVKSKDDIYKVMNYCALNCNLENPPVTEPLFKGTRETPTAKAKIININDNNFTPQAIIKSFLVGITSELYNFYKKAEFSKSNYKEIIGSGNGIRKNLALQKIIAETFKMPLTLSKRREEAAYGVALLTKKNNK